MSAERALRAPLIALLAVMACAGCTHFENPIEGKDGVELDAAILGHWQLERPEGRMDLSIVNFLSLRETGNASDGWRFFRYEISGDRFRLYPDADRFWKSAVTDKIVSGRVEKEKGVQYAVVTASGEELYNVVRGYGAVIFSDEMVLELVRVPD